MLYKTMVRINKFWLAVQLLTDWVTHTFIFVAMILASIVGAHFVLLSIEFLRMINAMRNAFQCLQVAGSVPREFEFWSVALTMQSGDHNLNRFVFDTLQFGEYVIESRKRNFLRRFGILTVLSSSFRYEEKLLMRDTRPTRRRKKNESRCVATLQHTVICVKSHPISIHTHVLRHAPNTFIIIDGNALNVCVCVYIWKRERRNVC